jgi:hypothetical protein
LLKASVKIILAVLCIALIIGGVSAKGNPPGNTGKSDTLFINLTEKDSAVVAPNGAWGWILDGGFGKLQYKTGPSASFVFNAAKMMPYTEYALISYKEPWLSANEVLGTAYSDGSGAVSIKGKYDVTTKFTCNKYPTLTSQEYQVNGTKIWLVPTDDLTFDNGKAVFIDWAPTEYLFETDLVNKGCIAPEEPATCDDQDPCTTDSYDAGTGRCRHDRISCDDGNALTTDTCDSGTGVCLHAPCDSGYADCSNGALGCETNINTDTNNCGGCGTTCSVTEGTAGCSDGVCTVAQCYLGYADCNGLASDGCEININTNTNCGSCGAPCSVAHGIASCETGQCAIASCDTGYADCNGYASDGCEANLNTNTDNCGGCGTEYACYNEHGSEACVSGSCQYSCDSGWTDCSSLSSAEVGLFAAAGPCQTDLSSDVSNCGTCGTTCLVAEGTGTCDDGTCSIDTCGSQFKDCDNNYATGCEANTYTDISNCGTCGTTCSVDNGYPYCTGGICGVDSCKSLYDDCDGDYENGCEKDTSSDPLNCKWCGITCSIDHGTAGCSGGECTVASCDTGYADCNNDPSDGCEINTDSDLNNCGGCTSPGGSALTLSDFSISPQSTVGTVCSSDHGTPSCTNGQCYISCVDGYTDCSNGASDGCETNTGSDIDNCGSCGNACSSNHVTPDCITGGCSLSCYTGYGDCDNDASTGCESDTTSDPNNCGVCYIQCGSGIDCVNGRCGST